MKKQIKKLINDNNSILLLTHIRPDGDAVGSVLSLYNYLLTLNKAVDMVIIEAPLIFNFLPGYNNNKNTVDKEYDLGIVVDCATKDRIGQNEDLLSKCKYTINIDHHISNANYCDINYVCGNISSCCQVIYNLFRENDIDLSYEVASSLAAGMITDTNGFRNDNVDSDTFLMAADLLKYGIDFHKIYETVLFNKSTAKYNLMKIALDRLELLHDGKIAFKYLLKEDFEKVGAMLGDHEGIVDIGRSIDGVEVSVFIRETDGFTISLRSTGSVDVNKVANEFGGGGHKMAAGGQIDKTLQETKEIVINEIKRALY